ncbi:hypothetical protein ACJX0J_019512, partial [Zea mays]
VKTHEGAALKEPQAYLSTSILNSVEVIYTLEMAHGQTSLVEKYISIIAFSTNLILFAYWHKEG